jgi:predicted nicotinamide N-methyase
MAGYSIRSVRVPVGGHVYQLRVLSDKKQFTDPGGLAERLGISPAQWSLFGQLWPTGQLLAQAMQRFEVQGKRVLELGCGIGLPSLVLQRRGVDIVASDMHPLAKPFLARNAALNRIKAVRFRPLRWDEPQAGLGRFDLIIASDVLHETGQARLLAGVIARHARPEAEVLVTDPGQDHSAPFNLQMAALGFSVTERRCPMNDADPPPYRGHLLHYIRAPGSAA